MCPQSLSRCAAGGSATLPQPLPVWEQEADSQFLDGRDVQKSFRPASGWGHLVRSSFCIPQLDVLFVLDSVEVLVQAVQQERQQLLAVVLLVAQELRGKVAHLGL